LISTLDSVSTLDNLTSLIEPLSKHTAVLLS
jgi:hypothetical protein